MIILFNCNSIRLMKILSLDVTQIEINDEFNCQLNVLINLIGEMFKSFLVKHYTVIQ